MTWATAARVVCMPLSGLSITAGGRRGFRTLNDGVPSWWTPMTNSARRPRPS